MVDDADRGRYFLKFEYLRPEKNCGAGQLTTHICRQPNCQALFPLACSAPGCLNCQVHQHCRKQPITHFNRLFKDIATAERVFGENMINSRDSILNTMRVSTQELTEDLYFHFLSATEKQTMEVLLGRRNLDVSGAEVDCLICKLQKFHEQVDTVQNGTKLIRQLQEKLAKANAEIRTYKLELIERFHQPQKLIRHIEFSSFEQTAKYFCFFMCFLIFLSSIQQTTLWNLNTISENLHNFNYSTNNSDHHILEESFSTRQKIYLVALRDLGLWNSTILPAGKVEEIRFVFQVLEQPSHMKLIYRASQHGFQASAFFQACLGVPHTFVLVLNEFGKVLAGYTPLPWKQTEEIQFIEDPYQKSFLLSVDLLQKLPLKNHQAAVRTSTNGGGFGFGRGRDLVISFDSNRNNYSESLFCYSYACQEPHAYDGDTWQLFTGSREGRFKVLDIEIYRVEKEQKIDDL